jgi:hypothetical protein
MTKISDNPTSGYGVPNPGSGVSNPNAGGEPSAETLQRLMDQAAGFSLYASPDESREVEGGGRGLITSAILSRFSIVLLPPSSLGVQAHNLFGESVGRLEIRWYVIPDDFAARPDRERPACEFSTTISQRFVMEEATFTFGDGRDGFRSFGTGRTFPTLMENQPRVVAAAIGNVVEGFGKFRGHEGNFTICGDLKPNGFSGHILVRMIDSAGALRTRAELPALQAQSAPDPDTSYLLWAGHKDKGLQLGNKFSFGPDGQIRGLNVPIQITPVHLDCACAQGFQAKDFAVGDVVAYERSFGQGSVPGASPVGTALSPFLFDGVARFDFFDSAGKTVGTLTTNFLEGKRFSVKLPGAPDAPALRYGWFGPIVSGSGCFHGVEGTMYGSTGSILYPPPGLHVITPFHAARIHDPQGKFRAQAASGDGWR